MPRTVPTSGLLPAAFSKTALLTIAIMSATGFSEQTSDLVEITAAERRIDHVHVGRVARQIRRKIGVPARLRLDTVLRAVVKDRAESPAIRPRYVRLLVDDEAGHALLML